LRTLIIDYRLSGAGGLGRFIESITPLIDPNLNIFLILNKAQNPPVLPFTYTPIRFAFNVLTIGEQVEYLFKLPSADFLFTPFFNAPFLFPLLKVNHLFTTIHDLYHLDLPTQKSLKIRLLYRIYLFFATRYSTHIFTVSHFSMRRLLRHYPNTPPVSLLYNSVNSNLTTQQNISKSINPELKGFLLSGPKPLLFVGNLKVHKNLSELIKLIALDPKLRLLICGTSVGRSSVERLVKDSAVNSSLQQRIYFSGRISDTELSYCYQSSECLVFPSLYEGFGIPLIEAQFHKLPVLCTDIPAFHEVCRESAIYFAPTADSIHHAVKKLRSLSSGDYQRLIDAGSHNSERYSWKSSALHFNDLLYHYTTSSVATHSAP